MTSKEYILNAIKSKESEIFSFGVKSIGLFGSYARNEQTKNSDIDILIDFEPENENFDNYMAVYDLIEELFKNQKVDIVTKNGLSPYIGPKILNEIEYLKHIRDESLYILSVITSDKTKDDFLADETLKRAVVRSLEIIGEATKKISVDFKLKWDTINWKDMAGMRDRLIHDYMGVNYSIVWDVVKNKIPTLYNQIVEITENK